MPFLRLFIFSQFRVRLYEGYSDKRFVEDGGGVCFTLSWKPLSNISKAHVLGFLACSGSKSSGLCVMITGLAELKGDWLRLGVTNECLMQGGKVISLAGSFVVCLRCSSLWASEAIMPFPLVLGSVEGTEKYVSRVEYPWL